MKFFIPIFILFSLTSQAKIVEKTQAQVASEMISLIDINNFQTQLRLNLAPSSLLLDQVYNKSELLRNKNKLLDYMISRNLLFQIAEKEKLPEISKKEIQKALKKLKATLSHKQLSKKLKKAGLSLTSLKEQILTDITNDLLLTQFVVSKIIISEQDIENYYFRKYNKHLFKTFEYEFISANLKENKKNKIIEKLKSKSIADLEETAHLLEIEYKKLKLKDNEIQKVFKKELDKLSVSQISPLIPIGDSYYILQLKWKQAQISPNEQKRKEKIEKTLYAKILKKEIKKWVEEKKTSFSIVRHSL